MVNLTIDKLNISVKEGATIMEAAATKAIEIPHICYLKNLNEIGACRVCVVELQGKEKLVTACNNVVEEGMVILTNSPKVRNVRKTNVQLILSQHDCHCATCVRSKNCSLQTAANDLGILEVPYEKNLDKIPWNKNFPLIRDSQKCIKCMRCIQVCEKIQGLSVWDVANTGSRTTVDVSGNRLIEDSDCSLCGQCVTHCPVGALRERDDTDRVFDALADPDKITVVQIAPSIRASWGEGLDLEPEIATEKRLVASLRRIGFDYIFDTNFSADLTIMEEASELLHHMTSKEQFKFPMFTSCCPGWIRFMKSHYREIIGQVSTAKSPQQMFGAVAKTYYAKILGVPAERIYCISIMPCIAKKSECDIPSMNDSGAQKDVDVVLTTREINRMIRAEHIHPSNLKEEEFDAPLGTGSGAGVIFGATGGVMEAALRTAYYMLTGQNPPVDAFKEVRGIKGWKEADFVVNDTVVHTATVSGLNNVRGLMEALKRGECKYDFVEVMACPGGCVGGGGQPIKDGEELAEMRGQNLYELDANNPLRFSHENEEIIKIYREFLGTQLSEVSHHLLHTNHEAWLMPGEGKLLR